MAMTQKRIFAVDDSLLNLTTIKRILKPYHQVYTAPSAEKMFELLAKLVPDLILLDIDMPGQNGYEAAYTLKCVREYDSIPIIFVTSRDDVESVIKGFKLGAADYICKPYSPHMLLKRVETQFALSEIEKECILFQQDLLMSQVAV